MDSIPVVSQIKSLVQWSTGDGAGARDTQCNFSKQCILVSQIRSTIEQLQGDKVASHKTKEEFFESTDGFLKKVPVLGHARGCIAYLTGDKLVGDEAMVQATKTTVSVAMTVFFLHGGILIGSGCWAVAQRVKEVEAAECSQGVTLPRLKRVGTTYAGLDKADMGDKDIQDKSNNALDMLDKTIDLFFPLFLAAETALPTPHEDLDDSQAKTSQRIENKKGPVQVVQWDSDEDEDEEEWGDFCTKRQISNVSTSSREDRLRLREWRESMLIPRL